MQTWIILILPRHDYPNVKGHYGVSNSFFYYILEPKQEDISTIFFIMTEFSPSKIKKKSRPFILEGYIFLGLFWSPQGEKGKTHLMTKLHIWGHSREGQTQSYSRINMVFEKKCREM